MDSKMITKRVRSVNFSLGEKELLFELVSTKKNALENKKTDAVSNAVRANAWNEIAKEFNATAPNGVYRSVHMLIKAYQNQKKQRRAKVAQIRLGRIATGGAPSQTPTTSTLTLKSVVNEKTLVGLKNRYDSDSVLGESAGLPATPLAECREVKPSSSDERTPSDKAYRRDYQQPNYSELCDVQIQYYKRKAENIGLEKEILLMDLEIKRLQFEKLKQSIVIVNNRM